MPTTTTIAPTSTDRIEKIVTFEVPRSRVWRAITDVAQFNTWFGISLDAPFTPGAAVNGKLVNGKYQHITFTFWIESLEPERFCSFRWHPYALEEGIDYNAEPTTLVTFTLEEVGAGTRLTIIESGFDAIPETRRAKAFSMNERGWAGQAENLRKYLSA